LPSFSTVHRIPFFSFFCHSYPALVHIDALNHEEKGKTGPAPRGGTERTGGRRTLFKVRGTLMCLAPLDPPVEGVRQSRHRWSLSLKIEETPLVIFPPPLPFLFPLGLLAYCCPPPLHVIYTLPPYLLSFSPHYAPPLPKPLSFHTSGQLKPPLSFVPHIPDGWTLLTPLCSRHARGPFCLFPVVTLFPGGQSAFIGDLPPRGPLLLFVSPFPESLALFFLHSFPGLQWAHGCHAFNHGQPSSVGQRAPSFTDGT